MNEPFTDLLSNPGAWSTWTPRKELEPRFDVAVDGGPGGRPALAIGGRGNPFACGCWRLPLKGLEDGRRYRIEAVFETDQIAAPGKSVRAILTTRSGGQGRAVFYDQLDNLGVRDRWHLVGTVFEASEQTRDVAIQLFLAWSAEGRVRWGDVRLYDVTDTPGPERLVHLAVISGNPKHPRSPAACIDFYGDRLDEAASHRVDLVCLPELINTTGLSIAKDDLAEPIPGPTSERLAEKARVHGMYVAASILERYGDATYNTGLLVDRTGGLVGKYRKTHLPINEGVLGGTAPGDAYPIFHTDFGSVGYMICYDGHFPEVPRILALEGADVVLWSNMGDGREGGSLWEPVVRTRAVDNQVHIAAAVNAGRSCIVSPKGEILAMSDRSAGGIAAARCDLSASVCDYTGRPIRRRYDQIRRADTYGELLHHLFTRP